MAVHLDGGNWQWAPHLRLLDQKIVETVEKGGRLLVEIPVRHGKSELCDIWTPIWFLEHWPELSVILASYEQTWATTKFGRRVRNMIEEYRKQLRIRLAKDLSGASQWETTRNGGMVTVGVGGPLTGRGAHLMLIDDPIKNHEEAASQLQRDKIWDWWENVAETRIMPNGSAIILMARWHEDDIIGRLKSGQFQEGSENEWEVLNMPALARAGEPDPLNRKPDEPLWPSMWSFKHLDKIRRGSARRWASLYQQSPRKEEGNVFDRAWFEIVDEIPASSQTRWVRAWDKAGTEASKGTNPDWTVGVLIGELKGVYYIADVIRFRGSPGTVRKRIKQTAMIDGRHVRIFDEQEPGQSGKDQAEDYARNVLRGFSYRAYPSTGSKETRADPFSASAEAGNVKLLKAAWNKTYLDELETFPEGTFDDQVDASSLGHTALSPATIARGRNVPKLLATSDNYWGAA